MQVWIPHQWINLSVGNALLIYSSLHITTVWGSSLQHKSLIRISYLNSNLSQIMIPFTVFYHVPLRNKNFVGIVMILLSHLQKLIVST